MEIETIKWKWADAVKSKDVYRDDQFIRTKTKEEALLAIEFLMSKYKGSTYTITVFKNGEYLTYSRHAMPCLGGLVKYRDSHGKKYFMNPYFPRDIKVAFPEGDIVYIALYRDKAKDILKSKYSQFIFSNESPCKAAFGKKETVIFADNHFVLTNMDTDPTVFYWMVRDSGFYDIYGGQAGAENQNPKASVLYNLSSYADPRRLAGQKPIKTSGGNWKEGWGYTRPYNESIFKLALPTKFKDFGSLPSTNYPPACPHTKDYFVSIMMKQFKVDVASTNLTNKKTHDALVEAWDYFKDESKKLDE